MLRFFYFFLKPIKFLLKALIFFKLVNSPELIDFLSIRFVLVKINCLVGKKID